MLSHSSVTNASGANLRFQGPEPAVCRRCLACRMGSHSITCRLIQVNPSLPYIREKGQTSAYCCCNLPGSEAGINLYCLVNRGTCVNILPNVITWQCFDSDSNLQLYISVWQFQFYWSAGMQRDGFATGLAIKVWDCRETEELQWKKHSLRTLELLGWNMLCCSVCFSISEL